jgi:hypothetical protein
MQTVDEILERLMAALKTVPVPSGMEQRIIERCASWSRIQSGLENVKGAFTEFYGQ